jgi:hypothetical protein
MEKGMREEVASLKERIFLHLMDIRKRKEGHE